MVQVAVDLIVLTLDEGQLSALLIQRGKAPFRGIWALPGGRVAEGEDPGIAARRELQEDTGIPHDVGLQHVGTYTAPGRDPRGRVNSIAFLALLPGPASPTAGSEAAAARWWPVHAAPRLAFDHAVILRDGVELFRDQIQYFPRAVALCADEFTLRQLRAIYEAVWGVRLNPRSFRREALNAEDFLRPTGRDHVGMGRPARLYTLGDADFLRPPLRRPKARTSAPAEGTAT